MAAQRQTDGYLFDLYRQYVGEPESRTDVYVGFGLFLGGIGLAAVALVLFLLSTTLERPSDAYWTVAQLAYAFGMIALPVLMSGIVVLLSAERRVLAVSGLGVAVTFLAVGGFVFAFPDDWNFHGENYTIHVVATYAVGFATLTASTGAALIGHYLDLAASTPPGDETSAETAETVSDEEIEQDIESAMDDVEISWGGVEKDDNSQLSFTDQEFEGVNLESGTKTVRSSGIDDQVAGLKGLKGGENKTTTSSGGVDDQTAKLKELREQKRKEAEADEGGLLETIESVLSRLKDRLFGKGGSAP